VLQIGVHLTDIGCFTVNELLGQCADHGVVFRELVQIFDSFDHSFGISLDHHVGNAGIRISPGQLHSCHSVRKKTHGRIQFPQFPTPACGNCVCFGFDGIILPQLGFQGFAKSGSHGVVQDTSDPNLPHLGGFQDGG